MRKVNFWHDIQIPNGLEVKKNGVTIGVIVSSERSNDRWLVTIAVDDKFRLEEITQPLVSSISAIIPPLV